MKNLLKREVREASTLFLAMRYNYLLTLGETLPANEISVADAREILWVEDELHRRLIKAVGHDFYPPDRIEEKPKVTSLVKSRVPVDSGMVGVLLGRSEPKPKPDIKIQFRIQVFSSLGGKAAEFSVHADSKSEADKLARQMMRRLRLQGSRYKMS